MLSGQSWICPATLQGEEPLLQRAFASLTCSSFGERKDIEGRLDRAVAGSPTDVLPEYVIRMGFMRVKMYLVGSARASKCQTACHSYYPPCASTRQVMPGCFLSEDSELMLLFVQEIEYPQEDARTG